jgi:hypothetical protein
MTKPFVMEVKDTFHFADGTTVFVGPIRSESKFIRPCDCEIVLDSEIKASIHIDGEMVATRKKTPYRSISTKQPIDLDAIGVEKKEFIVRSKEQH